MTRIRWPEKYQPGRTDAHIVNSVRGRIASGRVWAWLVHPVLWPSYYPNASDVVLLDGAGPALALGTRFTWKTFGDRVEAVVEECEPGARLAWRAWSPTMDVYHAWLIAPYDGGVEIVTEESQIGEPARRMAAQTPNPMHTYHQLWLENLAAKACVGWPPPA
jgi:hypothetical protein